MVPCSSSYPGFTVLGSLSELSQPESQITRLILGVIQVLLYMPICHYVTRTKFYQPLEWTGSLSTQSLVPIIVSVPPTLSAAA